MTLATDDHVIRTLIGPRLPAGAAWYVRARAAYVAALRRRDAEGCGARTRDEHVLRDGEAD